MLASRLPTLIILAILAAFAALVGAGVTGSSFHVGLRQTAALVDSDSAILAGSPRPIRSDEWAVISPMAAAQANHEPPFPVVNGNLGLGGHNMLVVGMTGVPVAHASALAKPATWGHFFLDMDRALAWQWWTPIFGCLLALWGTMHVMLGGRWGLALAASAVFTTSAYTVAWSNWPAYAVMFPAAAFWLLHGMLTRTPDWRLWPAAVALGLAAAGFVLVLYPPWQVSVGYLFLVLTAAVLSRDKLWRHFDVRRLGALALALVIAGVLCALWYLDARPAIAAIQESVYPGQRVASSGGDIAMWRFFRGFLTPHTLYFEDSAPYNQSELASVFYFFPVAMAALALRWRRSGRPGLLELCLAAFCLWIALFQLIGIPAAVAELSLWGRVPDYRSDLSLGLASLMLCALVAAGCRAPSPPSRPIAALLAAAFMLAVLAAMLAAPADAVGEPSTALLAVLTAAVGVLSWLLLRGHAALFLGLWLTLTLAHTAAFHPLAKAPSHLTAASDLLPEGQWPQPVLSAFSQVEAMNLAAAGLAVVNGIFYYTPQALWDRLDPTGEHRNTTQRYQHLRFEPGITQGRDGYDIEAPQPDVVRVTFDPARFDFRRTGARSVVVPANVDLSANPSVRRIAAREPYVIYEVE